MTRRKLTVAKLFDQLKDSLLLELVDVPSADGGGEAGDGDAPNPSLARQITSSEISSPGLVLAGFTDRFVSERIQVLGETEIAYLLSLSHERRCKVLSTFFAFHIPCVFVTKAQDIPVELVETASRAGVPLIRTALKTNEFYRQIKPMLEDEFAPTTTIHGSLADVYGVGLLFVGQSGIGKSECVLDLVERGHRLVADDVVIVTQRSTDVLIGRGHELQQHHMEIRGVGVLDVRSVFGIRAVRLQKRIEVVVELQEWDKAAPERTGLDVQTTRILDVEIPKVTIPLNPGKNITVVAEVVAMNHLLRYYGIDTAELFNQRLINRMRAASATRQYLRDDYE